MVFLQFGWGRFTGTEDLYIEDCMKLQNEPKRVKTVFNINIDIFQHLDLHSNIILVYGDNGWFGGNRRSSSLHCLSLRCDLHQADETYHQQTYDQWTEH